MMKMKRSVESERFESIAVCWSTKGQSLCSVGKLWIQTKEEDEDQSEKIVLFKDWKHVKKWKKEALQVEQTHTLQAMLKQKLYSKRMREGREGRGKKGREEEEWR
jgi:hypothetical protein